MSLLLELSFNLRVQQWKYSHHKVYKIRYTDYVGTNCTLVAVLKRGFLGCLTIGSVNLSYCLGTFAKTRKTPSLLGEIAFQR
jgi:hypothetical protein